MVRWARVASIVLLAIVMPSCGGSDPTPTVRFATTTSTRDSGLLDQLLPGFESESGIRVQTIVAGTGQALELGRRGDVDVLLVHARDEEDRFVTEGYGRARYDLMYNDFVIVGPASDPASVAAAADVSDALGRIAATNAPFLSRGDRSGTHLREESLWSKAERDPTENEEYISAGVGMGRALLVASEKNAYTLTDRGT